MGGTSASPTPGGRMLWLALLLFTGSAGLRAFRRLVVPDLGPVFTRLAMVTAVLAALSLASSFVAIVPAGHVGVAVVFGRVQDRQLVEGLNLVNPFATVEKMTVRTETYTMSAVANEG